MNGVTQMTPSHHHHLYHGAGDDCVRSQVVHSTRVSPSEKVVHAALVGCKDVYSHLIHTHQRTDNSSATRRFITTQAIVCLLSSHLPAWQHLLAWLLALVANVLPPRSDFAL